MGGRRWKKQRGQVQIIISDSDFFLGLCQGDVLYMALGWSYNDFRWLLDNVYMIVGWCGDGFTYAVYDV